MWCNVVAPVTINMSKCTACGSILETIEYQARSADEATRVTTTCPSCPVDASKLNLSYRPKLYPRGLTGSVRRNRRMSERQSLSTSRKVWRVKVEVTRGDMYTDTGTKHITSSVNFDRSRSISSIKDIMGEVRYQVTGVNEGKCETIANASVLGFGASLEVVQLYDVGESKQALTRVHSGYYQVLDTCDASVTFLYRDAVTNKNVIIVQSNVQLDNNSAAKVVTDLYSVSCVPRSLNNYLERRDISEYANLCPRAWDVSTPPTSGYKFTSKPDGERMWLVLYGLFWYGCTVDREKKIVKWWCDPYCDTPALKQVVCDTEYVSGYGFIFIDALTEMNGKAVPVIRDLDYSLNIAREIQDVYTNSPLIVREYFSDNNSAQDYSGKQPYPTDGTLGIRDGSTETVKIKPVKGIDLVLSPGGALVTNEGDTVAVVSEHPQSYVGKVVEVRFTAKPNDTRITVLDIFPRTNKSNANSTEAAMNILRSCVETKSTMDKERTIALKWCNLLCTKIIDRALAVDDTKHIVLDVGTGSGQSLDRLRKNESVSFIYLEPDEKRAVAISRRSGAKLFNDISDIGSKIMALKTRRMKHIVINAPLKDLTDNEELCKALMPELKCVIATFSAQFVITELRVLRDKYTVKTFGCMYTYDWAVDGILVDGCGASMKITHDDVATIQWGSEKVYEEPVTYEADYYGLGNVVLGSDILALPTGVDSGAPSAVCKHIRVMV